MEIVSKSYNGDMWAISWRHSVYCRLQRYMLYRGPDCREYVIQRSLLQGNIYTEVPTARKYVIQMSLLQGKMLYRGPYCMDICYTDHTEVLTICYTEDLTAGYQALHVKLRNRWPPTTNTILLHCRNSSFHHFGLLSIEFYLLINCKIFQLAEM